MFYDIVNGRSYPYETLRDVIESVKESPMMDEEAADEIFFYEYDDITGESTGVAFTCRDIADMGGFELDIIE